MSREATQEFKEFGAFQLYRQNSKSMTWAVQSALAAKVENKTLLGGKELAGEKLKLNKCSFRDDRSSAFSWGMIRTFNVSLDLP